jgi:predicted transcriptional regulator
MTSSIASSLKMDAILLHLEHYQGRGALTRERPTWMHVARLGYTRGMKTAVSVPDDVFARAEDLAKRLKLNRSQLFSRALAEFVARHAPEDVTDALDRVCAEIDDDEEADFVLSAGRQMLRRTKW